MTSEDYIKEQDWETSAHILNIAENYFNAEAFFLLTDVLMNLHNFRPI